MRHSWLYRRYNYFVKGKWQYMFYCPKWQNSWKIQTFILRCAQCLTEYCFEQIFKASKSGLSSNFTISTVFNEFWSASMMTSSGWWRFLYSLLFERKCVSKNAGDIALTCCSVVESIRKYIAISLCDFGNVYYIKPSRAVNALTWLNNISTPEIPAVAPNDTACNGLVKKQKRFWDARLT